MTRCACRSFSTRSSRSTTCRTSTPTRCSTHKVVVAAPSPASGALARRVLGIDPGLRSTGFGVISVAGSALGYVTCGCIRTGDSELPLRLGIILRDLAEVIARYEPTEVAIEKVFVNVNPQST